MGSIAQQAQTRSLDVAKPKERLKELTRKNWPRIQAVIGNSMSADRLLQMCISEINRTPHLAECTPETVLSCFMKCSALGIEPSSVNGLGACYILPFRNKKTGKYEATFVLGYKGMLDLVRRSGEIRDISARAVHEGDEFHYSYGLHEDLVHVPCANPGKLTHVYMVANFKDGGHYFLVMSSSDINKARNQSKAANNGPWVTHPEEMAKKTVIRRAFPYLPVSVEARSAGAADEQTPDYSDVFHPIVEDDDDADMNVEVVDVETAEPTDARQQQELTQAEEQPDDQLLDKRNKVFEALQSAGFADEAEMMPVISELLQTNVPSIAQMSEQELDTVLAKSQPEKQKQ